MTVLPQATTTPPQARPMLATPGQHRPWATGWVYERLLPGRRCLAGRDAAGVRLWSSRGRDLTPDYPEVATTLAAHSHGAWLVDGVLVDPTDPRRVSGSGYTRPLVPAGCRCAAPTAFHVFDVLAVGEQDVRHVPLLERKHALWHLISWRDRLRYSAWRSSGDEDWYVGARADGWGGLVAKRGDAPYVSGPSALWQRFPEPARPDRPALVA